MGVAFDLFSICVSMQTVCVCVHPRIHTYIPTACALGHRLSCDLLHRQDNFPQVLGLSSEEGTKCSHLPDRLRVAGGRAFPPSPGERRGNRMSPLLSSARSGARQTVCSPRPGGPLRHRFCCHLLTCCLTAWGRTKNGIRNNFLDLFGPH